MCDSTGRQIRPDPQSPILSYRPEHGRMRIAAERRGGTAVGRKKMGENGSNFTQPSEIMSERDERGEIDNININSSCKMTE